MSNFDLVCNESLDDSSEGSLHDHTPRPTSSAPSQPSSEKVDQPVQTFSSPLTWTSAVPEQSAPAAQPTTVTVATSFPQEADPEDSGLVTDEGESDIEGVFNVDNQFIEVDENQSTGTVEQTAHIFSANNDVPMVQLFTADSGSMETDNEANSGPIRLDDMLASLSERDVSYAVPTSDSPLNPGITSDMRGEVVSWFADLVQDASLPESAIAIATNVFDRFLARTRIDPDLIFAISSACFLIACKIVVDEEVLNYEIADRTRVPLGHLNEMERVILTDLNWVVNVVSPYEVLSEIEHLMGLGPGQMEKVREMQSSLAMAALLDSELVHMRATAVGVACHAMAFSVLTGFRLDERATLPAYVHASESGVPMDEVEICLNRLRSTLALTSGFIEDCSTEVTAYDPMTIDEDRTGPGPAGAM